MTVSIPEKTLEHWVSMCITYRYRSHAGLWWPTLGEDVRVGGVPVLGAGKAFHLEIKTATPNSTGTGHEIKIDLLQLQTYVNGRMPVYYVFPLPGWLGVITEQSAQPWLAGTPHQELGFSRTGELWFADWMRVVPARTLHRALTPPHGASTTDPRKRLLTYNPATANTAFGDWFGGMHETDFIEWWSFWDRMDHCGDSELAAMFFLSQSLGESPTRDELAAAVLSAGEMALERLSRGYTGKSNLVAYAPVPDNDGARSAYSAVEKDAVVLSPRAGAEKESFGALAFLGATAIARAARG